MLYSTQARLLNLRTALVFIACLSLALMASCGIKAATRTTPLVLPKTFPKVNGISLENKWQKLPDSVRGRPVVLLIGYDRPAQFDIDRWMLGLMQSESPVKIMEVAARSKMSPTAVIEQINLGLRSGVPEEDWHNVLAVYEDVEILRNSFGNDRIDCAYVVVLDKEGKIVWFHNRGYSAHKVIELDRILRELDPGVAPPNEF